MITSAKVAVRKALFQPEPRPVGNLAPAFQLVRQLLAERPRTFQQILQDGVAITSSGSSAAGPSEPGPQATPPKPTKSKGRMARSKRLPEVAVNVVPAGHPFVSATFLKKRILPVLSSQDLISKSAKATDATPQGVFAWSLSSPTDPSPSWSSDAHWNRLITSQERPGTVAHEYNTHRSEIKEDKRLAALDNPANRVARRTERDVWAWAGRNTNLTTTLERDHLNVRKANARPEKERARAAAFGLRT